MWKQEPWGTNTEDTGRTYVEMMKEMKWMKETSPLPHTQEGKTHGDSLWTQRWNSETQKTRGTNQTGNGKQKSLTKTRIATPDPDSEPTSVLCFCRHKECGARTRCVCVMRCVAAAQMADWSPLWSQGHVGVSLIKLHLQHTNMCD